MDVIDLTERDDVADLLRLTLDTKADQLTVETPRQVLVRSPRPRRRVGLSIAAATIALAGTGAVAGYQLTRDDTSSAPAAISATTSTSDASAAPTAPLGAEETGSSVQWYLPTFLPDGYVLMDVAATVTTVGEPDHNGVVVLQPASNASWVRRSADGAVEATLQAHAFATVSEPDASNAVPPATLMSASVHGESAAVTREGADGIRVDWSENGYSLRISSSSGLTPEGVLSVAEASTLVDGIVGVPAAAIPDGYETGATSTLRPGMRFEQIIAVIGPVDGARATISVLVAPAWGYDVSQNDETERRTIDGIVYSVNERELADDYHAIDIWWTEGDRLLTVSGEGDLDDLLEIAASVQRVPIEQAQAAQSEADVRTRSLPRLGTATFQDGLTVTAYRHPSGDGAVALCTDSADARCVRSTDEASTIDDRPPGWTAMVTVFEVAGTSTAVGWSAESDVSIIGGWSGPDPEVVAAANGDGYFFRITLPDDEPWPSFHAGDLVGLSPTDDQIQP